MFETHTSWLGAQEAKAERQRQKQLYRRAPRPSATEIEKMVASFVAAHGVTECPPRFLLPTNQAQSMG